MSKTKDFDVFKSLWTNINAATVPKPLPGQPEKACFLMEMPGFSVDHNSFDITMYDPYKQMHPDRAVALLADRVPALAPYFYDTGSHISFYWKQLLETFKLSWRPENDAALKAKYEEAIKMLYGDEQGYIEQRKTKLFQQLEPLRKQWQEAMDEQGAFWKKCIEEENEEIQKVKKKEEEDVDDDGSGDEEDEGEDEEKTEVKVEIKAKSGAQYFQAHAGPYVERTNQAFTEYDNLKSQIEQYEAAIFQYTRGDLSRLFLKQEQGKLN